MKQTKPRLIKFKIKGVNCAKCVYALGVDARHGNYYCTHSEKGYRIYNGEHVCGKGEKR